MRIDHVQVAAPPGCEAAAREFYGGLLGLRELEKPESLRARGGVWFEQLHVGVVADEHGFYHASRHHGVVYQEFNEYWLKHIDGFRRVPQVVQVATNRQ